MEGGCTRTEGGEGNQSPWSLLVWAHALDLGSPVCSEPREAPSPQQHTATFSCMDGSPKLEHRNWETQQWVVMSDPFSRPLWPVVPCSSLEAPRPYTHMSHLLWQAPTGAGVPGSLERTEEGAISGHVDVFRASSSSWPDRAAWTLVHPALLDKCPKQDWPGNCPPSSGTECSQRLEHQSHG